jgi:CspA family cold shock protein
MVTELSLTHGSGSNPAAAKTIRGRSLTMDKASRRALRAKQQRYAEPRLDRRGASRGVVIPPRTNRAAVWVQRRDGSDTVIGTVKRVVPECAFGFITGEDGQEYFFHRTGLTSSLSLETRTPHQQVSFEVEGSDKGPGASHVRSA